MMKVSMAVDSKGIVRYSRGIKNFNLRGSQFSLAKPTGGRRNTDILLREDQLPQRKAKPSESVAMMFEKSIGAPEHARASHAMQAASDTPTAATPARERSTDTQSGTPTTPAKGANSPDTSFDAGENLT